MQSGAIVLCGGHSRRMGRDKAQLPFGDENLLSRVVRVVTRVVDEVVVVVREDQPAPDLPENSDGAPIRYHVARDPAEGLGPLAGLVAGLEAMQSDRAFLTSCDVPLIREAYLRRLFELAVGHPAAIPRIDGHYMVTSAVYDRQVLPVARQLVAERRLRPLFLLEQVAARIVEEAELRECDPELRSFHNCNTPEDYREALRIAGLE